jgi:hypothetical protein
MPAFVRAFFGRPMQDWGRGTLGGAHPRPTTVLEVRGSSSRFL